MRCTSFAIRARDVDGLKFLMRVVKCLAEFDGIRQIILVGNGTHPLKDGERLIQVAKRLWIIFYEHGSNLHNKKAAPNGRSGVLSCISNS